MPVTKSESLFAEKAVATPAKPCPICGKLALFATRPFCAKRCADIDLHRWLGGVYAIPAVDAEVDEEARGHDPGTS
jgi:endogenous inhibitor of DNA gyrase (YacG/DUF329 family)